MLYWITPGDRLEIDVPEVRGIGQVESQFLPVAQAQAPGAYIGHAGVRVERVIDTGSHIGAAVEFVLEVERKLAEVHIIPLDYNLKASPIPWWDRIYNVIAFEGRLDSIRLTHPN